MITRKSFLVLAGVTAVLVIAAGTTIVQQGPGAGNEIQLTDAMETLMQSQAFHAYEFEGVPYDCGSIPGYFEAVLGFGADREDTAPVLEALLKRMADKT